MPDPKSGESQEDFMDRCMGDSKMNDKFENPKQRAAVCNSYYKAEEEVVEALQYGRPKKNDVRKTPAEPSERRKGSKRNKPGSAKKPNKSISFSRKQMHDSVPLCKNIIRKWPPKARVAGRLWECSKPFIVGVLVLSAVATHQICQEEVGVSQESKPFFTFCEMGDLPIQITSKTMTYCLSPTQEPARKTLK